MFSKMGSKLVGLLGGDSFTAEKSSFQESWETLSQFHTFSDFLPFESFDEATQLFYQQASLGFVLETLPLVGSSSQMQKEIANLFQQMMPQESSLQVLLWADPHVGEITKRYAQARSNASPILQTLAGQRARFLENLSLNSPYAPYNLRTFRCFLSASKSTGASVRTTEEELLRLKQQMTTTLEMLGLPVHVWQACDLLSFLEGLLGHRSFEIDPPKSPWNPHQPLREQVFKGTSLLEVESDSLLLNDQKIRTYSVRHFPQTWSLHAMGELIGDMERDQAQIPCPFMIHYGVYIPKQDRPKTKVLAKATYVERQAFSSLGKYIPSLQRESEELQFVRSQLAKEERIVQTHLGVTLFCQPEGLNNAEQILLNLFASKEWKLECNRFLHLPMLLSSLPMMWGEDKVKALLHLRKLKTTLSTESSNLLPLQGEWHGTPTPGMILGGRRGQIFTWYPFDNTSGNYNVCVVGRSGSGKSVFMQELMTSTLGLGGCVFVLDVGRSFEKTCFLLKGQFIEFTSKTPLCLNPFSTIPTHNDEVTQDALAMLKSVLILMAAPSQGVDDKGAALLEQAMLETWQRHQTQSTITHISQWLCDQDDLKAKDLGTMLFPYTKKGTYGRFFEGPSTVNLNSSLVVIELEELKERKDLQAVIVQMMVINITNRMFLGDRQTPFHIVFDEAWDMLRGSQTGVFIETLARRLRKYRGSLVVGTQSIHDFFVNPGAQAAFDNSDWMCLLSQKPESIEQLKKTNRLSLTPHQEAQLKSVKTKQGQYAEVMITGACGYAIGRLLLDPFSGLLYSTKPEDYTRVQSLQSQGFDLLTALERVLEERREEA